jgi:multiple sugar transport system permease protein
LSRRLANLPFHLVLVAGAVVIAFPFLWMLSTSFKTLFEAMLIPPEWLPSKFLWQNYADAFQRAPFARYFANTALIAGSVTFLDLVTGSLAAYAFARMQFRGRTLAFLIFLGTLMVPFEVLIIPDFVIMRRLNWYDTFQAQIAPFAASAFTIFLLRQFFASIPGELFESAVLDGAGHLRFLWQVVLPLSKPALITAGLLTFLASWNSFLWPLIVTAHDSVRPIQLGLQVFSTELGTQYQLLMAGSTVVILPVLALFLIFQRHLIETIARSGLKG